MNALKRVCVLTSVHEALDVRIFCKECKSLARAGHEVTLIAPHSQDALLDGVRIKAVTRYRGRLARMTFLMWRVYREAVRQQADVYHFHDPELILVGLLLRAQGKKVIYDIHEDVPRSIYYKEYLPRWLRQPLAWLIERFENLACRAFSALVTATPHIAERFQGLNRNTVVVHNYVRLEEFQLQGHERWSERSYSLVYLGAGVTRVRGAREMVEAMGLLPEGLPASLKLTGPFQPSSLKEELAALPGWKRIELLGVLDRVQVARVLRSVRAGVVVEHPESNHLWAKPIKLFEYMAAAIPVIASDFPVWREIIKDADCGLLVDPLKPWQIAQAIEYILTHPEEAEVMGCRGRAAVERYYNWAREEGKLLELYARLIGPARAGKLVASPLRSSH